MELTEEELQAYDRLSEAEANNPIWLEMYREFGAAIAAEGYGFDEEGRVVPLDPSLPERLVAPSNGKFRNIHTIT